MEKIAWIVEELALEVENSKYSTATIKKVLHPAAEDKNGRNI